MFELGCVNVPRSDGTYFSTIYNKDLPVSSTYAAIVVNSTTKEGCEKLTDKLIAFIKYWEF
jgi:hypothetical protein